MTNEKPSGGDAQSPAEPVAWQCTDERYPWIKGIVTDRKVTVDAWREGGIEFVGLGPLAAQPPAAPVEPSAWHCPACEAAVVVVDDPTPAHERSSAETSGQED